MVDGNDPVKLTESYQRPWLDVAREFPGVFPTEDFGGFLAGEVLDHLWQTVARFGNDFKEKNFRRVVGSEFLVPDGNGRATTYRIKGAAVTDLAEPFREASRSSSATLIECRYNYG